MAYYAYDAAKLGPYVVDPLAHIGLARKVARQFRCRHLEPEDLEQEALCVLCAAARTYDPSHGATFATWAVRLMGFHLTTVVSLYRRVGGLGGRGRREIPREVREHLGSGGDVSPVALRSSISKGTNRRWDHATDWELSVMAMVHLYPEKSLDAEVGGEDGDSPGAHSRLSECIENPEALRGIEDRLTEVDIEGRVNESMAGLRPKERDVIVRRVFPSLRDEEAPTLEDVGASWEVTRQRVQQIEANALYKVQEVCEVLLTGERA